MSYAKIYSSGIYGIEAFIIEVEVDISRGLPAFNIVGLASKAVEESRERVKGAIKNSGFQAPSRKITVNLAPAGVKKEGAMYDLAVAIAILLADQQFDLTPKIKRVLEQSLFIGELSLDGRLRRGRGILPIIEKAKQKKIEYVFLPYQNLGEASLVKGVKLIPLRSLKSLLMILQGEKIKPQRAKIKFHSPTNQETEYDFAYIKGQENAKRALMIAAAGGHNVLMIGPPGTGKTLLARSLPSILPRMNFNESLEVTRIYSAAGQLAKNAHFSLLKRPFRAPHHTASHIALVGGGSVPQPGEVTLAHHGVLFLDEFPEFSRQALEALRQPLEDGRVTISRASGSISFPADFILIAAANPCPCGYFGDPKKSCRCTPAQIATYHKKLSGPLLDRVDLQIQVPRLSFEKLSKKTDAESSQAIRHKIEAARAIQIERFNRFHRLYPKTKQFFTNSQLSPRQIEKICQLSGLVKKKLKLAVKNMNISVRGYHKILKLSRTIADLEGSNQIKDEHIFEAIAYYEHRQEM